MNTKGGDYMQIIKKESPFETIEVGDLVIEPESDVACWVVDKINDGEFPYPLISVQTGKIVDWYCDMKAIRNHCKLLAKNDEITLTYWQ